MARLEDTQGRWLELTPLRRQYPASMDDWDGSWLVTRFRACDGTREWTSQPDEVATVTRNELLGLSGWLNALAACARDGEQGPADEWEALEPSIAFRGQIVAGRVALDVRLNYYFRPPESNDGTAGNDAYVIGFDATPLAIESFAVALGAEASLASTR
jgi:hypothetical protein